MKDLIDRAEAMTEIRMNAWRYTLSNQSRGGGYVMWEENIISVKEASDILRNLPSAQQEIIHCKDCKHRPTATSAEECVYWGFSVDFPDEVCPLQCDDPWYNRYPEDTFFCGKAERKEEI